jgi:hypothetical protein
VVALRSAPCGDGHRCAACGAEEPPSRRVPIHVRVALPAPACASCAATMEAMSWSARFDLLDSSSDDAHFTVENDDEGYSHLRFGDGVNGRALEPGMGFHARYRTGSGP